MQHVACRAGLVWLQCANSSLGWHSVLSGKVLTACLPNVSRKKQNPYLRLGHKKILSPNWTLWPHHNVVLPYFLILVTGFRGDKAILLLTKSMRLGASPIFFSLELKCHVLIEMWPTLGLFTSVNLNLTFWCALNKVASQQVYTFVSMVYWCDVIAPSVTFTAKTAFYIWKMLK